MTDDEYIGTAVDPAVEAFQSVSNFSTHDWEHVDSTFQVNAPFLATLTLDMMIWKCATCGCMAWQTGTTIKFFYAGNIDTCNINEPYKAGPTCDAVKMFQALE